jgi:anaerobic magnesium-protoporphyrin IX monomethyl ester cyclase
MFSKARKKTMKVLLIEPNICSYALLPPIALTVLKGFITKKTNHQVRILDLAFHKNDWQEYILGEIRREQPDLIGFSVLSFNVHEAIIIARFIKEHSSVKIIFGGVKVILSPQEIIRYHEVDIICTGEGEKTLKELLDNQLNCSEVEGIWYKKKGKIVKNKPRRLISDLDTLVFPDFDDFDMAKYFFINNNHLSIIASRGCPYSCSYCSNHALKKVLKGTYVRFRSVENVLEEIDFRMKQYYGKGMKYLYFFDDTFILDKEFVYSFCERIKEKGYHNLIRWNVNVRANLVDDDLLKTMKDAGCYQVRMGVETGNESIRNKVYNRDMTNQQISDAFESIHRNKLQLRLYFMVGAPDETIEMMNESLTMAQRSHADDIFFALLYRLPGTEIRHYCEQEQIITTSHSESIGPVHHTKYVTHPQLHRFMRKVQRWQIRMYIIEGIKLRGLRFLLDCLWFVFYDKPKYDFEMNQLFRWNVQRYKLEQITEEK